MALDLLIFDVFNVLKDEDYYHFYLLLNSNETMGAGAGIHGAYFSSQTGILACITTFSVLLTAMMNFAPQSGVDHRIMHVFCDSQMLGFPMHLMQAQLCNYALKGLEDATVMTGQLPVCLLMWQSNLSSQQMERALLMGVILSLFFFCFFFYSNKHLLLLNRSGVASLIPCFPANHTLSSLSDCFL